MVRGGGQSETKAQWKNWQSNGSLYMRAGEGVVQWTCDLRGGDTIRRGAIRWGKQAIVCYPPGDKRAGWVVA
jgi:hypothetical protein